MRITIRVHTVTHNTLNLHLSVSENMVNWHVRTCYLGPCVQVVCQGIKEKEGDMPIKLVENLIF